MVTPSLVTRDPCSFPAFCSSLPNIKFYSRSNWGVTCFWNTVLQLIPNTLVVFPVICLSLCALETVACEYFGTWNDACNEDTSVFWGEAYFHVYLLDSEIYQWKRYIDAKSVFICFSDDEDSECLNGEGKVHPSPGHNQSYLCIPFQKNEDWDGPSSDANEESTPVNSATSTPQLTPTNSLKRSGSHHKRCEIALLGCGAVLAAAGLGFDLLEAGKCQLLIEEEPEAPKEEKKKRDSLFQRAGRPRRSTSPPSRKIFRKDDPMLLLGEPSTSLTLLSLSSISECNSTRSLLRSDSDEIVVYEMPVSPVTVKAPMPAITNPLVNVQIERFKQDPNQSLTPTHVTLSSHTQQSGHRRTPSDGAIRGSGLVVNGCPTSGCPSSSCLTGALGAGRFSAIFLFLFRIKTQRV